MSKTILFGVGGNKLDVRIQKWSYFFLGAMLLGQGFLHFFSNGDGWVRSIMIMLMFFGGGYAIIFALFNFSKSSKYAPKLKIDDLSVELKTSLFKKRIKIKWKDIQSVSFKPYRVDFKVNDAVEVIAYDTTSDISIDIKETLREVAAKKDIEVIGG